VVTTTLIPADATFDATGDTSWSNTQSRGPAFKMLRSSPEVSSTVLIFERPAGDVCPAGLFFGVPVWNPVLRGGLYIWIRPLHSISGAYECVLIGIKPSRRDGLWLFARSAFMKPQTRLHKGCARGTAGGAALPKIGENDQACDRRICTPNRGKTRTPSPGYNQENHQVDHPEDTMALTFENNRAPHVANT